LLRRRYILIIVLIITLFGNTLLTLASPKSDNRTRINVKDIKESYFNVSKGGNIEKFKLSEFENAVLIRLIETSYKREAYSDYGFNKRIINPYITICLKSGKESKLFFVTSGYVVQDGSKLWYYMQIRYSNLFNYFYQRYKNKELNSTGDRLAFSTTSFSYEDFCKGMRKAGITYEVLGKNGPSLLLVPSIKLKILDEEVNVYTYKDNIELELEAMTFDKTGGLVNGTEIDWVSMPHFYKKGNILVAYIGKNNSIIEALKALLGYEFSGGDAICNNN
jgi:hypothetical protein